MQSKILFVSLLHVALLVLAFVHSPYLVAAPPLVCWDGKRLEQLRSRDYELTAPEKRSVEYLRRTAEKLLSSPIPSVVNNDATPSSGDKHDYMSYGTYWWPDPKSPNGLPYVRRDGVSNKAIIEQSDLPASRAMSNSIQKLSLAAYLVDDERYGPDAAKRIHAWFVSPETKMNPHLKFGQGIPGRCEGRSIGIIDTWLYVELLDAIELLESIDQINPNDSRAVRRWFSDYLDWLLTSKFGRKERVAQNNHGTWYAAQVARMALFVGKPRVAKELVKEFRDHRIAQSFKADGRQPLELSRTQAFSYAKFNLRAMFRLAKCGDKLGLDLWNYESQDGAGIRQGFSYVYPYLLEPDTWLHQQIVFETDVSRHFHLIYQAQARWPGQFLQAPQNGSSGDGESLIPALLYSVPKNPS